MGPKLYAMFHNKARSFLEKSQKQQHQQHLNTKEAMPEQCVFYIPMYHKIRGFNLGVFILFRHQFQLLLINRDATVISTHEFVIDRASSGYDNDSAWHDNYCRLKESPYDNMMWFSDIDVHETLALKSGVDCLYNYNLQHANLLVCGKNIRSKPLHAFQQQLETYRGKPHWKTSLFSHICLGKHTGFKLSFLNLCGPQLFHIIVCQNKQTLEIKLEHVSIVSKTPVELDIRYNSSDVMTHSESTEFVSNLWSSVNKHSISFHSEPLLSSDDTMYSQWMKFLRTNMAPILCDSISALRLNMINVPTAWHHFQGHRLSMAESHNTTQPHIMFHGVRGNNVEQTVHSILKHGFNSKYTKHCAYGAGGTYCSPQIQCALEYTTPTNTKLIPRARFMFVCFVLTGNVKYGGRMNESMDPDQNAWCANLPNGHQIYCVEAILPIALLTIAF